MTEYIPKVIEVKDDTLEIRRMLIEGLSKPCIRTKLAGVKQKTFSKAYDRALNMLIEESRSTANPCVLIAQYNELYQKLYQEGEFDKCKDVLDSIYLISLNLNKES